MIARIEYRKELGDERDPEHWYRGRVGYIGPIRIPLKAALALITWEVRISHAWKRTFRPHLLHPQELSGYDGEPPYFLRVDLADTKEEVVDYWIGQWCSPGGAEREDALAGMEPPDHIVIVWMVERVDPTKDPDDEDGCWYDATTRDAPGAVAYWRWNEA